MGPRRLQFKTKPDINGHVYNVVIDVDNKLFARDRYISNSDFLVLSQKDLRRLVSKLTWLGFIEINI